MSKRHGRVAPPPRPGGWDFRHAGKSAAEGWDKVSAAAPGNARTAWERITTDPRQRDSRQHPLKGTLGTRVVNGASLEQWQYEVTGAGRLWYCIDDARRIVWLMEAATAIQSRPSDTSDRVRTSRRRADWTRIADLVEQYGDFPLGGTDASVIALAERLGTPNVVTLDRRHFAAVRPLHCDALTLLP